MKQDVLQRIKDHYDELSKSHKSIAAYVLENYEKAAFMTAARLGEEINVSESTVVRFAIGIGYSGYPPFVKALGECVQGRIHQIHQLDDVYSGNSQSEIITAVLNSDIEKIQHTIQHLDVDAFETAVESIINARTVYVMGLRSNEPLAAFLHFYLDMVRGSVKLVQTTSVTEIFEQMLSIGEEDCFVGISFPRYSMRTLKAMEFANDRNAKVIAITDSIHSPMNLYSSCHLLARSDMASIVDSLVAPLSVINALVVALCLKCPEKVKNKLKTLEEVWNNYQVYLNDEINFIGEEPILDNSLFALEKGNEANCVKKGK